MTNLLKLILGFIYYILNLSIKGSYKTNQKIMFDAQSEKDSLSTSFARFLLGSSLENLFKEHKNYLQNINQERLSSVIVNEYSDDSLKGYGDINFDKGGKSLETQQRGLILNILEELIQSLPPKNTVVEIGAGNGDVIAYLADKYPNHNFVGVDFSIKNMKTTYGHLKNLSLIKGYPLDLLASGQLTGDVVFGSSTFCLFTPIELESYVKLFKQIDFKHILLNEPSWSNYTQTNDNKKVSRYLDSGVWYHNYAGYLINYNFKIQHHEFFKYKHPTSGRPDINVCLISATDFKN